MRLQQLFGILLHLCLFIFVFYLVHITVNSKSGVSIPSLTLTWNTTTEKPTVENDEFEGLFIEPNGLGPTGIYVRNIFRAKDDEIQMFFLRDWRNTNISIEMKVNNTWLPFNSLCYYPVCRGTNFYCSFMDYFAYLPIPEDFDEDIAFVRVSFSNREHQIKILDVRSKETYEHDLAVVLQPAYYLADWQNLIQYFESWLSHGATKFYIYYYSWSKKVQQVIDFYQSALGHGLEVVSWSSLPSFENDRGIFGKDPNTLVFNLMNEAALNNALYRSRGHAKYLAVMDLDELTIVPNGTLLDTLEELQSNRSDIASFRLEWVHSSAKVNLVEFDKPSDVHFEYLKSIEKVSIDSMPDGYFAAGKCIHRPDRTRLIDHHNFIHLEWKNQSAGEPYQGMSVDTRTMMAVHLRRVFDADHLTVVDSSDILVEHAEKLQKAFRERLFGSAIAEKSMSPWVNHHASILNALHDCRQAAIKEQNITFNWDLERCRSIRACEPYLTDISSFVMAEMAWTNIAEPYHILGPPQNRNLFDIQKFP